MGEEPEGFFGSFYARWIVVEHNIDTAIGQLFGPSRDFVHLGFGDAVGHDGEGWDVEVVEVDDVVESFDDDQSVLRYEFAVAGFIEAAGLLTKKFLAAMKAFGKAVLGWRLPVAPFARNQTLEFKFLLFVMNVAGDPA